MSEKPANPRPFAPTRLPLVPATEIEARTSTLAQRLAAADLDAIFLLHPSSHFWISGTLADGFPFVMADGKAVLPVRMSPARAALESPLPQVAIRRPGDLPAAFDELGVRCQGKVGLELDVVPAAVAARLAKIFPNAEFLDASFLVREARAVKSPYEIAWVESAARILCAAMDEELPARIRPGVAEIELAAFLEGELRRRRHQGVIRMRRWNSELFFGTVSAGASASYPCYFDGPDGVEGLYPAVQQGGGERKIEAGVPVFVDYVSAMGGYIADRTRVYCLGEPAAEAKTAHEFCREILAESVSRLRPGAIPAQIHAEVHAIAAKSPWRESFMGWGDNQVKFLGHGVGLDLDEFPVIAPRFEIPLAPGNVIALEPKVFFENIGGVGLENTYVITENGCRNVTPGYEEIRILARGGEVRRD
jgi:Xaa-Pro aminopeptidase